MVIFNRHGQQFYRKRQLDFIRAIKKATSKGGVSWNKNGNSHPRSNVVMLSSCILKYLKSLQGLPSKTGNIETLAT